jgi:hypothetical protein
MSSAGPAKEEDDENRDRSDPLPGSWKPVNSNIWSKKVEAPQSLQSKVIDTFKRRLFGIFSSAIFLVFVAAPLGGLGAYLTFYAAFLLGGIRLFGLYFLSIWGGIAGVIIVALEKSGYSRNFEGWDSPLKRLVFLPVGFLLLAGFLYLIFFLGGRIH